MKRSSDLMPRIVEVENLLLAYYKARRGKQSKEPVIHYSKNLYSNILKLREELCNESYVVGRYHYFKIFDPKERQICAASFQERVIHHAVINVCKERFESNLIYDTYASREGKGVYAAIDRAKYGLSKYPYVVKLDVRKFFDSVSHDVLKKQLCHLFKDKKLLRLFDCIIDSYETEPNKGIPIGNLTSQYFANLYLSQLDHYIKEVLHVPVYVRYMDDMLLFATDRAMIKKYMVEVLHYVNDVLFLNLKPPQIVRTLNGVSFLGYLVRSDKILLNRRSKIRFKRKMMRYIKNVDEGKWTQKQYMQHVIPLMAFACKARTRRLRETICAEFEGNNH